MKRFIGSLGLGLSLVLAGGASGSMCTLDDVPSATLLLPYFEVDWQDPGGKNTVFSINNASPESTLVQLTFWTDWSQPTLTFNIFLTGYDVVPVDLYEIFQGIVPITADEQNDPGDTISPHGLNAIWDASFPSCIGVFPFGAPGTPIIPAANLVRLRMGHTGLDVFGLGCMGQDHRDGIARGYITIDSINRCNLTFPSETGYFLPDGQGVANNRNVLWGTYSLLDPERNQVFGEKLVAIEAEDGFTGSAEVPGYTFYGRYQDSASPGADNREPLAFAWAAEYVLTEPAHLGTDLLVWRDSTTADTEEFYPCNEGPSWTALGLGVREVVAMDQEENAVEICFNRNLGIGGVPPPIIPDPDCFPLETQRTKVGLGEISLPYSSGWLFLNLNEDDSGVSFDVDFGSRGDIAQAYVTSIVDLGGQYQVGFPAVELFSACRDLDFLVTDRGTVPTYLWEDSRIFDDSFETGDLSRWSVTNP